jgi:quercetin dioxygenase-like cupin family protein
VNDTLQTNTSKSAAVQVPARADRFGERHGNGIGIIDFKVTSRETDGIFVVEMTVWDKGGPPRHRHLAQDEWFYVLEGTFIVEVGQERFRLCAGDSAFAPRQLPHAWAKIGGPAARLLGVLSPAGSMEAFVRKLAEGGAMGQQDPTFWPPYGMELVGGPLPIDFRE